MGFFSSFDKKGEKKALSSLSTPPIQSTPNLPVVPVPKMTNLPTPPIPKKPVKNINKNPLKDSLPPPPTQISKTNNVSQPVAQKIQQKTQNLFQNVPISLQSQSIHPSLAQEPTKLNIPQTNFGIPDQLPQLNVPTQSQTLSTVNDVEIPFFPKTANVSSYTDEEIPLFDVAEQITPEFKRYSGPLFVRTDRYKQVLTNIDIMKTQVQETPELLYMLKNLKKNADIEHKNYAKLLEDIQRKLIYVDNILFKNMGEKL